MKDFLKYAFGTLGLKAKVFAGVVIIVFIVFYIVGIGKDTIDSIVELKYLIAILGIPIAVFFLGNYINYKKQKK